MPFPEYGLTSLFYQEASQSLSQTIGSPTDVVEKSTDHWSIIDLVSVLLNFLLVTDHEAK
jgi:hypothetical protein